MKKRLVTIKNNCICKRKGAVLWRDRDCWAKFHTGKKSVIKYDPEELELERQRYKEEWRKLYPWEV